ncbi:iron-sulfur cluster assembly accessory protein [Buchnera aphidicola (Macrosiphoniella sanborni)]|uniref:Iron-sulfur cluster assembly accessory protein n=1 Tax=Buchnera aphidicola (Macrosiphoniella sanborni) TaxID=1241865 RepID=A0A4D6YDF9_9GAMM|nr:iron-sulfur cluster assembly accessory protein [Buchnera aphidicola]QCI23680.1 iron-sulfur cluster assembly accessory protein [Buchnera aphidicola (Macrosiphoniella sanborni)]
MKKYEINTYILNKKKWKGISITKSAIHQMMFLINLDSDNKGIRLNIKKSGCAGFRYTMELVKHSDLHNPSHPKEVTFLYKNILIYIFSQDMPFLEGVKIDYIKNNINKVFKFYNTKLDKFCGCGESFAINFKKLPT